MKEKPILFSAPMVRAILSGTKTQTRRLKCPYRVGDLLWVRETFRHYGTEYHNGQAYALIMYKDGRTSKIPVEVATQNNWSKWTPAIHMPRWAARLYLEVTGVQPSCWVYFKRGEIRAAEEGV